MIISILLLTALVAKSLGAVTTERTVFTTSTELNLNTNVKVTRMCRTQDDKEGICVSYRACRSNYTIDIYGNIDENEVRAGNCPGYFDWCCVYEGPWKEKPEIAASDGCTHATQTDCPWCVALYRDGGNPRTKSASGLFCGGALIGSGLVLTSASCMSSAKEQQVWVRIQDDTYNVTHSISHPQYDSGSWCEEAKDLVRELGRRFLRLGNDPRFGSFLAQRLSIAIQRGNAASVMGTFAPGTTRGTREFDFAILALKDNLDIELGACIQLNYPRNGQCRSYNFDENDNMVMTNLSIATKRCGAENSDDTTGQAACGRSSQSTAKCRVSLGAPVICTYQDGFGLWGIARTSCISDEVHIGPIAPDALWVKSLIAMPPANGIR